MTTVGVIGLGDIGAGVATNVAQAGHHLVVCDISAESMARFADMAQLAETPDLLASRADVVIVAVVNDAQVIDVFTSPSGLLAKPKDGLVVAVVSTVALSTLRALAEKSASVGVQVLDCGVSGGPGAAADGGLVAMVGGQAEVIEAIRPVLDSFTSLVVHMGPLGAGLMAKLARNLVQYGSWLAAYEGQLLAEAAGIELAKLAEVIRASDRRIGGAATLMLRDTVAPFSPEADPRFVGAMRAAAGLAHKDLQAALALAVELEVSLPLAELTDARCERIFGIGEGEVHS